MACCGQSLRAQQFSLSTNLLDWAALGGANLSAGMSVTRHLTLEVGGVYNPHSITKSYGLQVQNKHLNGYAAVKYWPWIVYSGWWMSAKAQYSNYSRTGILNSKLEEGQKVGGGVSFGYTLMLSKKLNLDFGFGLWGGYKDYVLYNRPEDKIRYEERGEIPPTQGKGFISPDKLSISLMYVF